MKRAFVVWFGILALSPVARAASSEEEAGDVSEVDKDALGPLRERIPPVTGHLFLHKHRFELSPTLTFTFNDPFFTKYIIGLDAAYHFTETVAVDARFGYALDTVSGSSQICIPQGSTLGAPGCSQPTTHQLAGVAPGDINLLGSLDLEWEPIYGKVALWSESFLHFDLYGMVGPSFVQYTGPGPNSSPQTPVTASMTTVGGNVGVGMRFFINKWLAVRLELRDLVYSEQVVVPVPGNSLRNQLMFDLGFSMFFPTVFQES